MRNRFFAGGGNRPKRSIISTCSSRKFLICLGSCDALVQHQAQMHVRQIFIRQQRRRVQIHFRPLVHGLVELRHLAGLQRIDRALQHFHIERVTDFLDLTALFLAEQFAGAANFEVVSGEREARAQVLRATRSPPTVSLHPPSSNCAAASSSTRICLVMRATDASA